jgi:mannosyl-oligosaccharide alpha-1,2-mannosidase
LERLERLSTFVSSSSPDKKSWGLCASLSDPSSRRSSDDEDVQQQFLPSLVIRLNMIRVRRLWLVPAFFLACVVYYVFLYPDDRPRGPLSPLNPNRNLHWTKRPEKYPLTGHRDFPIGPLEVIPKIQFDFEANPESADATKKREARRAAVKEAFLHSWNGYKRYAWAQDEVAPVSGGFRSSFGGWGATMVDTMDTLWIMGLKDEFDLCVQQVKRIDFTTNDQDNLNVFETTIRYLGGLLAAYDLSDGKTRVLLDKARGLGEMLYSAFDTPHHMPQTRWEWKKSALGGEVQPSTNTLLAELGSLTVEFTRLSQLTGDFRYFDAVQRIAEEMEFYQNTTKIPGLWPTIVNARDVSFDYNHFTFGGMADSTYEYLPKQYMMLGGRDNKYRHMYEEAIEAAKRHLFFRPLVPGNENLLFSGNAALTALETIPIASLEPQGQHLACFVAGMVGIGSKIFSRKEDMDVARRLLNGCVWAYNSMPSGLMPETFHLIACQVGTGPPTTEDKCTYTPDKWYDGISKKVPFQQDTSELSAHDRGYRIATKQALPPGFTDIGDKRYILRPEAIESVFILYRITGDTKYQDIAWKMFQAIDTATRTEIAHAAVHDVRVDSPQKSDRMESFWLAETLKYFYLIFSEPELVSLDEWVLNTEAHPLKRPIK